MSHAATAVLQAYNDWSPIRRNNIVTDFGKLVSKGAVAKSLGPEATDMAKHLNYVYDKRVIEEYGEVDEADADEAAEILDTAEEFVDFCSRTVQKIS